MILTAEEYARGFIDFDAILPEGCTVELWTRTADHLGEETEWAPMSCPPKTGPCEMSDLERKKRVLLKPEIPMA